MNEIMVLFSIFDLKTYTETVLMLVKSQSILIVNELLIDNRARSWDGQHWDIFGQLAKWLSFSTANFKSYLCRICLLFGGHSIYSCADIICLWRKRFIWTNEKQHKSFKWRPEFGKQGVCLYLNFCKKEFLD